MGKRKSIVIVAEGALDRNLKPIKPDYVKDILVERLGLDTRVTTLGHTQRGGKPCAYDRILVGTPRLLILSGVDTPQPTLQGVQAVQVLLEAKPDTPSYMIGIQENKITKVPLLEAVAQVSSPERECCWKLTLFRLKPSPLPLQTRNSTRPSRIAIPSSMSSSQRSRSVRVFTQLIRCQSTK